MDSWKRFNETELPSKDKFYSKLNLEDISNDDYAHAIKLDPAYFLTTPGLSSWACLKKAGVKLELLTDENMFSLYEKGIRGGMCQVTCKYAEANNKYMKNYDKNKESSFLIYVDANNLYG